MHGKHYRFVNRVHGEYFDQMSSFPALNHVRFLCWVAKIYWSTGESSFAYHPKQPRLWLFGLNGGFVTTEPPLFPGKPEPSTKSVSWSLLSHPCIWDSMPYRTLFSLSAIQLGT